MAKMRYLIHRKNRFKNIYFGETKIVFKLVCFNTAIFFRSTGDRILRCLTMRHIFHYFPTMFTKHVLFLRLPDRPETLPVTIQNVENSPASTHLIRPPKMTFKPTNLIRNENIQFTATTCRSCDHKRTFFSRQSPVVHF